MLYVTVDPGHAGPEAVMAPGLLTKVVTDRLRAELLPQLATEATLIVPYLNPLAYDNDTVLVPWPDTIATLAGTVHKYELAPATGLILYTAVAGWPTNEQTCVGPVMLTGVVGRVADTESDRAELLPHGADATTETEPELNPGK